MRCRTVKRRPQDCRWEASKVCEIKVPPRHPNPKDLDDQSMKTEREPEPKPKIKEPFEEKIPPPEVQPPREIRRRNFRITKKILEKYGYAAGCPGCEAMMDGTRAREHNRECRDRFEQAMEEDPVDRQKIRERDERAYLGEPQAGGVEAEQQPQEEVPAGPEEHHCEAEAQEEAVGEEDVV